MSPGTKQEAQIKRKVLLTIVGIIIVIILVLLAIYLFQRVR
jgi:flagellar biogenesis protein FliO